MGEVVQLGEWRDRGRPEVVRLEEAVARLDGALSARRRRRAPEWLATEILAIQGCIFLGLIAEATQRTDRLVERLASGKGMSTG